MTDWTEEDHSLRSGDHQGENDLRDAANDLEQSHDEQPAEVLDDEPHVEPAEVPHDEPGRFQGAEDHSLRSGDHQGENDLRGAANDLESAMSGVAPSDPRVAEAVARLEQLSDLPPEEHVEVYEDVHRVLQDSLSAAHDPGEGQES